MKCELLCSCSRTCQRQIHQEFSCGGSVPASAISPGGRGRHEWYSVTNRPPALITERKEPVPLCDHDHGHGSGSAGRATWATERATAAAGAVTRCRACAATPAGGLGDGDVVHQVMMWSDVIRPSRSASRARARRPLVDGAVHARTRHAKHRRIGGMQASSFQMLCCRRMARCDGINGTDRLLLAAAIKTSPLGMTINLPFGISPGANNDN